MRTGVLHQIPVLHTKFFVTCERKRNFKKSPLGLQLRETPAVTKKRITKGLLPTNTIISLTLFFFNFNGLMFWAFQMVFAYENSDYI